MPPFPKVFFLTVPGTKSLQALAIEPSEYGMLITPGPA